MKRVGIKSDVDAYDAGTSSARQREDLPFRWNEDKLSDVSSWAPDSDKFDFYSTLFSQ